MPKGDRAILKADPEDGHTPIANLLLEALAIVPLSGVERGAVLALWRVTYGWKDGEKRRTEVVVSLQDWARFLNTHPVYAGRVVSHLVEKKVIKRVDLGKGKGYCYSMNTRVNEWVGGKLNDLGLTKRFSLPPTRRLRVPSTNKFTPSATNLASPKKNNKENLNKGNNTNIDLGNTFISGQSVSRVLRILRKETCEHEGIPRKTLALYHREVEKLGIEV